MGSLLAMCFALLQPVVDFARVFVPAAQEPPSVTFYFQNRHEEASFALLDDQGAVKPDAIKELSHFVRCWRTDREKQMNPRLIEIVAAIAEHFHARIEVVSGYRARPYGAPHSKHFLGRAMDIHLEGVPAKAAARWVWENFRHVGVGWYPKQDFFHVDVRELDVRWIDTSRHGESAHARYFGRRPAEETLPDGAPRLAYDVAQERARAEAQQQAQLALATQLPWN